MNSVKLLPLSIFVEIADAVKVNCEGFKMLPSLVNPAGGLKGLSFILFFHSSWLFVYFIKRGEAKAKKTRICFRDEKHWNFQLGGNVQMELRESQINKG